MIYVCAAFVGEVPQCTRLLGASLLPVDLGQWMEQAAQTAMSNMEAARAIDQAVLKYNQRKDDAIARAMRVCANILGALCMGGGAGLSPWSRKTPLLATGAQKGHVFLSIDKQASDASNVSEFLMAVAGFHVRARVFRLREAAHIPA